MLEGPRPYPRPNPRWWVTVTVAEMGFTPAVGTALR